MGFVDAVKDLAQSVGMTVPEQDDKIPPAQRAQMQAQSLALSDAMTQAADFYKAQLRKAPAAIAYLKGRGLTGEIAARFALGYAPEGWDNLRAVFPQYDAPVLAEAGLVIDKVDEEGRHIKRYDRFRERVMFPIRNTKGQVIAFGGRIMEQGEPKYLNSPETPLFSKGSELYGLFEARQAIRDAGYVLVTEGYMDVVALAQMGFPQAVATLGTACTTIHVQKLLRQTDTVVFSFDGDRAGRKAARRALEACLPYAADDKTIKFLFLPAEHDPDSYIREYGAPAFEQQVHEAMPLSQFLLREAQGEHDLDEPEGRARVQFDAKPMLQAMAPSALRLQIVRGLATMTQSTPGEIEALFELSKPVAASRKAPPKSKRQEPVGLELKIIRCLITHPSLALELDEAAQETFHQFGPEQSEHLVHLVQAAQALGEGATFAALAQQLKEEGAGYDALIGEIAAADEPEIEAERMWLKATVRQLKIKAINAEVNAIFSAGKLTEELRARYHALKAMEEALTREEQSLLANR